MSSAVFTIAAALQGFSVLFVMNHAAHDQAHNDYQNCSYNKCSHIDPPLSAELFCLYSTLYVYVQSPALLVRTEQQINESDHTKECYDCTESKMSGCDQCTDLIDAHGNNVSQTTLISDCEPEPLCIVHLSLDCSHSCEARCA